MVPQNACNNVFVSGYNELGDSWKRKWDEIRLRNISRLKQLEEPWNVQKSIPSAKKVIGKFFFKRQKFSDGLRFS